MMRKAFRSILKRSCVQAFSKTSKVLTLKTLPKRIVDAEYAVRGAIAIEAEKIT